jgi:hypothetical protein
MPLSTSTGRAQRLFKVKWAGYGEPTWEPLANLSCGGLVFDYLRQKKRDNRLQMVQVANELLHHVNHHQVTNLRLDAMEILLEFTA